MKLIIVAVILVLVGCGVVGAADTYYDGPLNVGDTFVIKWVGINVEVTIIDMKITRQDKGLIKDDSGQWWNEEKFREAILVRLPKKEVSK